MRHVKEKIYPVASSRKRKPTAQNNTILYKRRETRIFDLESILHLDHRIIPSRHIFRRCLNILDNGKCTLCIRVKRLASEMTSVEARDDE